MYIPGLGLDFHWWERRGGGSEVPGFVFVGLRRVDVRGGLVRLFLGCVVALLAGIVGVTL